MDAISEIIQTFSSDTVKEFKVFINRKRQKKQRKDLELFELLLQNPQFKSKDLIKKLYTSENTEAYHAVRKKLLRHLMDFLVLKRIEEDTSDFSNVMSMISLARYLFEHQCEALAWKFLNNAKTIAIETEQYDQLNIIYNLQIDNAESEFAPELDLLLDSHKQNKLLVDENERANIAYSIIKHKLKEVRLSGKTIDFNLLINNVLLEQQLSNVFFTRPRIFFQIMNIFRSAIVATKEYYSFEPFLIENFNKFDTETGFERKHIEYKSNVLYMIAHTLYRNKKFKSSLHYLDVLIETVSVMNRTFILKHYPRYIMLLTANMFFTANIEEAIEKMEASLVDPELKLQSNDHYNIILNLCFYYIYNAKPALANKCFMQLFHNNKWYEKQMGKEWVLKKNLLDVIIQYDLGNEEIALNRIRAIERSDELIQSEGRYERVGVFLNLVKQIVNDPYKAVTHEFTDRVEEAFDWVPMEQEDLQAVMYYAWFKSKITKRPSYEVLLKLTGSLG